MLEFSLSQTVPLTIAELIPAPEFVLRQMGVPKQAIIQDRLHRLAAEAIELFSECAEPVGLLSEIPEEEFAMIYKGEGGNAEDTPLEHIFTKADNLAVYALTLGSKVSEKIDQLCKSDDVALGGALDATASVAADNGTEFCEKYFQAILSEKTPLCEASVLAYSPGYCGWHVSGQKKLFQALKPEQIGITLTEACLMIPIKSVSGVLIAGKREINFFEPHWDFCITCSTYPCLQRMKSLRDHATD